MACSKCAQRAAEARARREAQRALVREQYEAKQRLRQQGATDQGAAQQARRRS
jgi:hypothetical protein